MTKRVNKQKLEFYEHKKHDCTALWEHDLESSQKSKLWEPEKFKPHKTFYIKQTWKIIMDIGSFFYCVCVFQYQTSEKLGVLPDVSLSEKKSWKVTEQTLV